MCEWFTVPLQNLITRGKFQVVSSTLCRKRLKQVGAGKWKTGHDARHLWSRLWSPGSMFGLQVHAWKNTVASVILHPAIKTLLSSWFILQKIPEGLGREVDSESDGIFEDPQVPWVSCFLSGLPCVLSKDHHERMRYILRLENYRPWNTRGWPRWLKYIPIWSVLSYSHGHR